MVEGRIRVLDNELLEKVGYNEEEVGGDGIPLPQPLLAGDPTPWHPIQEDRGQGRPEDGVHPVTPAPRKASHLHDLSEALPVDGVKSLREIQLEVESQCLSPVTALDDLGGIDEILGDAPPFDKAGLGDVDDPRDLLL